MEEGKENTLARKLTWKELKKREKIGREVKVKREEKEILGEKRNEARGGESRKGERGG